MTSLFRLSLTAFACLLFLFAARPAAADEKVLDVQSFTTPAGIPVWLVTDKTVPVISMRFSFKGGLMYDPADKPGVGRLVSILLDEGAGDMKSQPFQKQLSDNAIDMSFDAGRDAFEGQMRMTTPHRDLAFTLLGQALAAPRFDADAVTRMKNSNIAEIRRSMGDPSWLVARVFNGTLFEGHPYARPGYGTVDSMEKITRADLAAYVKAQFARGALKVAIAGDIGADEAKRLVDLAFGGLPEKQAPYDAAPAALKHAGQTVLLPLDTPQTFISVAENGIARKDPDWHAAMVMNYILGGDSFDARLMREIREKRGLTYGVYSSLITMDEAALIQASLSTSNDKAPEALGLLRQQWELMAQKGPTAQEVADAKAYLTGSLMLNLTSTDGIAAIMESLMQDDQTPDYINKRNALIDAVTPDDVRRVAQRILKTDDLLTVLVGRPTGVKPDVQLDKAPGLSAAKPAAKAQKP
jgi:zinc protease